MSSIPGGSPVALADPEGYASSYLKCARCGDHTCDRCAQKSPALGPHTPCPKCGGALAWQGVPRARGAPAGGFGAPMGGAAPPGGGAFGAPMGGAAPAGGFGAPMGGAAPSAAGARLAGAVRTVAPADLAHIPAPVKRQFEQNGTYERTAPLETMYAEILAMDQWLEARREKAKKLRKMIGFGALAAFPAALIGGVVFQAVMRAGFLFGAGAAFVGTLVLVAAARSFVKVPWASGRQMSERFQLLSRLVLSPGSDVVLPRRNYLERFHAVVTLASGIQAKLVRVHDHSRQGRYMVTTADDQIALSFPPGRYPSVTAIGAELQKQLQGIAGDRAKVRASASELAVTLPVALKPTEKPIAETMPPILELLHKMLEPNVHVVDMSGRPPAGLS